MKKLILLVVWTILISLSRPKELYASSSDCTRLIPQGGAYDIFRSWSSSDFQLAVDDYVFRKDYHSHDEALSDGLSVGTVVYGVPLQVGNTFSQSQKDIWKSQYQHRYTLTKVTKNRDAFERLTLNRDAIAKITACIIATSGVGLQTSTEMAGDCVFTFSASYRSVKVGDSTAKVLGPLRVSSGTGSCDPWPSESVLPGPLTTLCRRFGKSAVVVTMPTDAGSAVVSVDALPDPGPAPASPTYRVVDDTHSGEFRADKTSSLTGYDLGEGAEIKVSFDAPGPVTSEGYNCDGSACGYIYVCPDHGKCGDYTSAFETSGNSVTFHAWTNSGDPATLIFPYTYVTQHRECASNCSYQSDLLAWQQRSRRSCPLW